MKETFLRQRVKSLLLNIKDYLASNSSVEVKSLYVLSYICIIS